MRKLQTSDVFATLRAIKAANLRDELKPVVARAAQDGVNVQDIGIEGILTLLEALADKKAEAAFYEVLAGPFEATPQEVAALDLLKLAEMLNVLAQENDLKAFFGYVSGILTRK